MEYSMCYCVPLYLFIYLFIYYTVQWYIISEWLSGLHVVYPFQQIQPPQVKHKFSELLIVTVHTNRLAWRVAEVNHFTLKSLAGPDLYFLLSCHTAVKLRREARNDYVAIAWQGSSLNCTMHYKTRCHNGNDVWKTNTLTLWQRSSIHEFVFCVCQVYTASWGSLGLCISLQKTFTSALNGKIITFSLLGFSLYSSRSLVYADSVTAFSF